MRISEDNDTTILNTANRDRSDINRGIYSDGYIRILCVIRGSINTDVLYNRGMRSTRTEDNGGILLLLLYITRVSGDVNKYNVYIYNKWNDRL